MATEAEKKAAATASAKTQEANQNPEPTSVPDGSVVINEKLLKELLEENKSFREKDQKNEDRMAALELGLKNAQNNVSEDSLEELENKFEVKTITLRRYGPNGKVVLEHENLGRPEQPKYAYQERNPNTGEVVDYLNIRTQGSEDFIKVKYLDFIQFDSTTEQFEIINVNNKPKLSNPDGYVETTEASDKGYRKFTGGRVKALVVVPVYSYDVNIDGVKETVSSLVIG